MTFGFVDRRSIRLSYWRNLGSLPEVSFTLPSRNAAPGLMAREQTADTLCVPLFGERAWKQYLQ